VSGQSRPSRRARPGSGQHFLASGRLAAQLVADAQVGAEDRVVELGAGTGTLTEALADRAAHVLAVELDARLVRRLAARCAETSRVTVLHADALVVPLPATPYRVVANPPFASTSALLRRLLDPRRAMVRADLIVQWQVARVRAQAHAGPPLDLLGATWGPWWTFRRGRRLPAPRFRPPPSVDAAVLVTSRRAQALLPAAAWEPYRAFVRRGFRRSSLGAFSCELVGARRAAPLTRMLRLNPDLTPPEVAVDQWTALFQATRAVPK
jgi:23S rRNA (adenine-N6)-dimethyltransferase